MKKIKLKERMGIDISSLTNDEITQIISERDFYKDILDKVPAAIHVNNLDTRLVEWINEGTVKISGFTREEIVNNPDFLPNNVIEEDLEHVAQSIIDIKQNEELYSYLYSIKNKNNTITTYHAFIVPFRFNTEGIPTHNLSIDVDITHEIRNFKQLKRQYEELLKKLNQHKINSLTKTEIEVIKQLCQGKTLKEVATTLNRSPHTIDKHIRNIFAKINIHKTRQLTLWAKEVGLV